MLSKSLIQVSVGGRGCVPSLLFDLRLNHGGGNEDNGDCLPKVPCMHCPTRYPQPRSSPLPTHTSTGDSWTPTGKSGSVSYGVTASFSRVLVGTRFCLCPPRVCFPQTCVSSGGSMVGLMATSSKRAYAIPRSTAARAPVPVAVHADPYLHRRHSNTALSQSLWRLQALVCTRYV